MNKKTTFTLASDKTYDKLIVSYKVELSNKNAGTQLEAFLKEKLKAGEYEVKAFVNDPKSIAINFLKFVCSTLDDNKLT